MAFDKKIKFKGATIVLDVIWGGFLVKNNLFIDFGCEVMLLTYFFRSKLYLRFIENFVGPFFVFPHTLARHPICLFTINLQYDTYIKRFINYCKLILLNAFVNNNLL